MKRGTKVRTAADSKPSHLANKEGIVMNRSKRYNTIGIYSEQWPSRKSEWGVGCILYFDENSLTKIEEPLHV